MSNDSQEMLFNLNKSGVNTSGIEVYHIADCCRACLRIECTLTTTDTCDEDTIKFCDKLNTCISEVEWLKEGLPSLICSSCISLLRIAYDFHRVCLQSNQTLVRCMNQLRDECDVGAKLNVTTRVYPVTTKYVLSIPMNEEHDDINKDIHTDISGPIENRTSSPTNSEYIHLKHFLDNEEELSGKLEADLNNSAVSEGSCEIKPTISDSNLTYLNKLDVDQHILRIEDIHTFEIETDHLDEEIEDNPPSIKQERAFERRSNINIVSVQSESVTFDSSKPFSCSICSKTYKKKVNLRIHMRTHTGEKPYECQYCEKRFYHSSHLREHHRRHTGEKPFACSLCGKRFTIRGELTVHTKSHTGEKPHQCNHCERRCLTAADLKVHVRTHTGEKPYACYVCNKKFASSYILNSHIKTHTGERPYSCNICGKTFTQSSHLSVHMRKHTGEKVRCKLCSETFTHSSQLTVHMRAHTGKQPFKCTVCNKVCNYASELQVHMSRHSGEKFSCERCDKKFMTAAYLHEHMRTHTGQNLVTCVVCSRQFTRAQYLTKHLRTHTGEKPFTCPICDKKFTQSSSLKVHIRTHSGERPFECNICARRFVTNSDLRTHVRKHKYFDVSGTEALVSQENLQEENILLV